jgi:TPR repeat protein
MRRRRIVLGIALAAVLNPLPAAEFDHGLTAYRSGDHGAAHDRWRKCALAGEARCQFALGALFDDGLGVKRDAGQALAWYQRAARQGFPDAMMQLGFLFATGRDGFTQDPVQAWAWFSRAASQGVPEAADRRELVGGLLSPEELDRARQLADQLSIQYHLQTN